MSSVSGSISVTPKLTNKDTDGGISNPSEKVNSFSSTQLANGTGADQIDSFFSKKETALAASATESFNLSDASMVDGVGNTVAFVKVKSIMVKAAAANASDITIDATITNGFKSYLSIASKTLIQPGGTFCIIAPGDGYVVTASTADIFAIENTDGSVTAEYELILTGVSA